MYLEIEQHLALFTLALAALGALVHAVYFRTIFRGICVANILYLLALSLDQEVAALVDLGDIFYIHAHVFAFILPSFFIGRKAWSLGSAGESVNYHLFKPLLFCSTIISIFYFARLVTTFDVTFLASNYIEARIATTRGTTGFSGYGKSFVNQVLNFSLIFSLTIVYLREFKRLSIKYFIVCLAGICLVSLAEFSRIKIYWISVFILFSGLVPFLFRKTPVILFMLGGFGVSFVVGITFLQGQFDVESATEGLLRRFSLVYYYFSEYNQLSIYGSGLATFYPYAYAWSILDSTFTPLYFYNVYPTFGNEQWEGIQPMGFAHKLIQDFGVVSIVGAFLSGALYLFLLKISAIFGAERLVGFYLSVFSFFFFVDIRYASLEFWCIYACLLLISVPKTRLISVPKTRWMQSKTL